MYGWNQSTIFYGPYDCRQCGKKVVRKAIMDGGELFDYPDGIIYPNTEWQLHSCKGDATVAKDGMRDLPVGGVVRPAESYTKPPSPQAGSGQSLEDEVYREYEFNSPDVPSGRAIYRINSPVRLWVGTTTHRVLDIDGLVHCVPNVGYHGCVLRWQVKPGCNPVAF